MYCYIIYTLFFNSFASRVYFQHFCLEKEGLFPEFMEVKSAEVSSSAPLQKEKQVHDNLRSHPYILDCYGEETTTTKNGRMIYNILLEYASGGTLSSLIKQFDGCGLPESDVSTYTRCILEGLHYIHGNGYVHCDMKPENVLLVSDENGDSFVPKIGGFGLAKRYLNSKRMKFDPNFGGTPLYRAPETVMDRIQEPLCDIWALGCIVLEMLTGQNVWNLKPNMETDEIFGKIKNRYEMPKIPTHISKEGKDFLKRCLVRNPKFRFTAEMLLCHPFVSGSDDDLNNDADDELSDSSFSEPEESSDDERVNCSPLENDADDELSDWSFSEPEEDYPTCWRDDRVKIKRMKFK
ncbi:mitogen-activated protein kinase kinase kinase 20-like [Euphorbia lathyris]|uniref:mitogen-activated protein kinase kinase kinase 20-like n=1 Tax=Euphorbia lathyris TaxID=212925 RepID=UPI003314021A